MYNCKNYECVDSIIFLIHKTQENIFNIAQSHFFKQS